MKKLNTIGDTILEVLIATAVVSTILGGAYTTASRSLKTTRESEERVEALKFGESQVEGLRYLQSQVRSKQDGSGYDTIYDTALSNFCVTTSNQYLPFTGQTPPANARNDTLTAGTTYPDPSGNGTGCLRQGGGVTYYEWIQRTGGSGGTPYVFTVHTRWASLNASSVNNEVQLVYRISP